MKRFHVHVAKIAALDQPEAQCCYARSDKYWITYPQGIAWETYRTLGDADIFYGDDSTKPTEAGACCAPRPPTIDIGPGKSVSKACC